MSLDSHNVFRVQTPQVASQPARFEQQVQPVPAFSFGTLAAADVSAEEPLADLPPSDPGQFRRWRLRQSAHLLAADVLVLGAAAAFVGVGAGAALNQSLWDSVGKAVILLMWLAMLALTGGYRIRGVQLKSLIGPTATTGAAVIGASAVLGLLTDWGPARGFILLTIPTGLAGLLIVRLSWYLVSRRRAGGMLGKRHVLVLGETAKAQHVEQELLRGGNASGYVVAEVLTWDRHNSSRTTEHDGERNGARAGDPAGELNGAAAVAQARDAVLTSGADLVVLTGADVLDAGAVRALAWELAELNVELATVSGLYDVAGWRLRSESVRGLAMVHVGLPRLHGLAAAYKRAFDIVFASLVLFFMAPLLLIGAAVKLDSRGPALFAQQRVGLDHSRFTMFKFRSMSVDAEVRRTELLAHSEGNEVLFKMRQDPRVTRVGRVLRRFSLDELPQFFNVLRGEMSVVGPRPPLPSETETYDDRADRRMIVKPGITGLWQVHGRSNLSWEESLRLDLYYVENWSPGTDLGIVLRTAAAMVTGAGAY